MELEFDETILRSALLEVNLLKCFILYVFFVHFVGQIHLWVQRNLCSQVAFHFNFFLYLYRQFLEPNIILFPQYSPTVA